MSSFGNPGGSSWRGSTGEQKNKIYVGNLSSKTPDSDIRRQFEKHGAVSEVVLKYDFAFVEMESRKDMEAAIELSGWRPSFY